MENTIRNIKYGQSDGRHTGFELARHIADAHKQTTGNNCIVQRVIDYVDQFEGRDREHISFNVIEII